MSVPLRTAVGLKEISVVKIKLDFFLYKHFLLIIIQVHVKRSLKIGIRIGSSFLHTCQCINNIVTHSNLYSVIYIHHKIQQHYTPRHYGSERKKKKKKVRRVLKVIQTSPSISVNQQYVSWPLSSRKCLGAAMERLASDAPSRLKRRTNNVFLTVSHYWQKVFFMLMRNQKSSGWKPFVFMKAADTRSSSPDLVRVSSDLPSRKMFLKHFQIWNTVKKKIIFFTKKLKTTFKNIQMFLDH